MIGEPQPVAQPPQLAIRTASLDDIDRVMAIMNAAFDEEFGERWTRSQCSGILPMPGVSLRVAVLDEEIAGFSLIRVVADEAELLLLAVDPRQQGHGLGRALLGDFMRVGALAGASKLHLEVRDGNSAISLYDHAGFRCVGRRKNYYHGQHGDSYDALTMMRDT